MKYVAIIILMGFSAVTQWDTLISAVQPTHRPITILVTGDVMMGRYVETLTSRYGNDYPFRQIASTTQIHDIVLGNLEGPIVTDHTQTENGNMIFSFPAATSDALVRGGFTHMSLANNHSYDMQFSGYIETLANLKSSGITGFGDPVNSTCREIIEVDDYKIGVIALNATWGDVSKEKIRTCVDKTIIETDFLIAYLHWGDEYSTVNEKQQKLAHQLIDSGVDTVIGHHPHVVQKIEWYKGKPIFYSLGNLVFDQYFSDAVQSGMMVGIEVGDEPLYTIHRTKSTRSQPKIISTELLTG